MQLVTQHKDIQIELQPKSASSNTFLPSHFFSQLPQIHTLAKGELTVQKCGET